MNTLETIFNRPFAEAIGLTLMHSLWQGALLAILLAFALFILRKSSSNLRYWLSITSLGLFFGLFCATFGWEYQNAVDRHAIVSEMSDQPLYLVFAENLGITQSEVIESNSLVLWMNELAYYFQQHAPIILATWLMGVLLLSLRLVGGYTLAQRMKSYKTRKVSSHWENRMAEISQQVGLRKSVKLMESGIAKVPMVIGHFKPVVLVPLGILTSLTSHQVEAILAHELAHIRRNDYLINLFQSVIEVLFFYHPAIWWISGTIRAERENACDDIAVNVCGDSLAFAKALSSLETRTMSAPQLAMAFFGKQGKLLYRIRRLVGKPQRRLQVPEGIVILSLVTLTLFSFAFQDKKTADLVDSTQSGETFILPKEKDEVEKAIAVEFATLQNSLVVEDSTKKKNKDKNKQKDKLKNKKKLKGKAKKDGDRIIWQLDDGSTLVFPDLESEFEFALPLPPTFEIAPTPGIFNLSDDDGPLVISKSPKGNILISPDFPGIIIEDELKNEIKILENLRIEASDFNKMANGGFVISGEDGLIVDPNYIIDLGLLKLDSPDVKMDSSRMALLEKHRKEMEAYRKKMEQQRKKIAELNKKYAEEYRTYMEKHREEIKEHSRKIAELNRERSEMLRKQMEEKRLVWEKEVEEAFEEAREEAEEASEVAREAAEEALAKAHETSNLWKTIEQELIADGLIEKKQKKVNFSIDGEKMEINGKQIDGKLHKKYLKIVDKYCKGGCSWTSRGDGKNWKFKIRND